jgi:nucleotide-binding universal stress UspA family protein
MSLSTLAEMAGAAKKVGERILMEATKELKSRKIDVETLLIEGNVVQEITRVAKEDDFDLVVMGIRELSKIKELIIGHCE